MAGILHGQAAVDELEKQLGRKPTAIETQIAMEEGYSKKTYRDTNNVLTSGWGQTGNNMGVPLDKVAAKYESRTQKLIPAYNTLPDFVKNRAFDATYRGTLGQSPMTVDLMNAGQYGDAADEFLNNQEYRDAVLSGSGVAKRMEKTADAFRVYGNQDTKQVVPQMATSNNTSVYQPTIDWWKKVQQEDKLRQQKKNPVPMHGGQTDPRGVPIMDPEESLMQQSVVPSMPSNEGHWLQSNSRMAVAEAKKQSVLEARNRIDMNGGQVDPRDPNQIVPQITVNNSAPNKRGFNFRDNATINGTSVPVNSSRGPNNPYISDEDRAAEAAIEDLAQKQATLNAKKNSNNPRITSTVAAQKAVDEAQKVVDDNAASKLSTTGAPALKILPTQPMGAMELAAIDQARENANPEGESRQGPVPGNRKQPVPPEEETLESITKKAGAEFDDQQTGSPDKSSYSPDGSLKDGEGNEVAQTKEEKERNKGIFDKASELFGDIFTAADLKRMVLYTVGGMITGGSIEGSFQWAAGKIMEENGIDKQNQLVKDAADDADASRIKAAALATTERKEAAEVATAARARETYIANKVDEFKLGKKRAYDIEVAGALADYNLGVKKIAANAKAPDGLKVNGVNYEVQGRWSGDAWINASNKTIAGVKPGQKFPSKTKKWNGSLHDPSSSGMRDRFVKIAEDLQDGTEDADGKPNTLGDSAVNSYSKFRAWVDEKAEDQGYYLDLNDPLAEQVYRISVKQAIDANAGKKSGKAGGMVTPESFYDGSLIRGYLGGQGADVESLFTDINRKPINVKTNDRLIGDIELHRKNMKKRFGGDYTTAQATHNFWTAWNNTDGKGITDDQRDAYNNNAGSNVSGFSKFVREYTLKDAAKQ